MSSYKRTDYHPCNNSNNDKSILSDINQELINVYNIIKYKPIELYESTAVMPVEKDFYYKIRSINPTTLSPIDRASRFIYLNRFCFNGLYRTNLQGQFNVPFSPSKSGGIPSLNNLLAVSERLQSAQIICSDFENTINTYVEKNFLLRSILDISSQQTSIGKPALITAKQECTRLITPSCFIRT